MYPKIPAQLLEPLAGRTAITAVPGPPSWGRWQPTNNDHIRAQQAVPHGTEARAGSVTL